MKLAKSEKGQNEFPAELRPNFIPIRRLAAGGQGKAWLVKRGNQVCVIKFVATSDSVQAKLLNHEYRTLRTLRHPNLLSVSGFLEIEPYSVLISDFVEGVDLEEAPLRDANEALEVVCQLCRGLEAIHSRGIIHGDIKPANICVTREKSGLRAVLLDFGVASKDFALLLDGRRGGTDRYIAPEVSTLAPFDHRADFYSLGRTVGEILERLTTPLSANEAERWDQVITRLTYRQPTLRYSQANEVIRHLGELTGRQLPRQTTSTLRGYIDMAFQQTRTQRKGMNEREVDKLLDRILAPAPPSEEARKGLWRRTRGDRRKVREVLSEGAIQATSFAELDQWLAKSGTYRAETTDFDRIDDFIRKGQERLGLRKIEKEKRPGARMKALKIEAYVRIGQHTKANHLIRRCTQADKHCPEFLNAMAWIAIQERDTKKAKNLLQKSLQKSRAMKNWSAMATTYGRIASANLSDRKYEAAFLSYRRALVAARLSKRGVIEATIWLNIGIALRRLERFSDALRCWERAIEYARVLNIKADLPYALVNRASLHLLLGDLVGAQASAREAYEWSRKGRMHHLMAIAGFVLGEIAVELGHRQDAQRYWKSARRRFLRRGMGQDAADLQLRILSLKNLRTFSTKDVSTVEKIIQTFPALASMGQYLLAQVYSAEQAYSKGNMESRKALEAIANMDDVGTEELRARIYALLADSTKGREQSSWHSLAVTAWTKLWDRIPSIFQATFFQTKSRETFAAFVIRPGNKGFTNVAHLGGRTIKVAGAGKRRRITKIDPGS